MKKEYQFEYLDGELTKHSIVLECDPDYLNFAKLIIQDEVGHCVNEIVDVKELSDCNHNDETQ